MGTRRSRRAAPRAMKTEAQHVQELADRVGVPQEQRAHLSRHQMVDLAGEIGAKGENIVVLINRGGTAVERWVANDRADLFGEGQQRAIRYTQSLWARADGMLRAVDHSRDVVDCMIEGMSQQEALDELRVLKGQVPRPYWDCYERVCRFDEEAGTAGSRLATNSRSAIDAAKTTVAFTASLIAQWRRL